WVKPTGADPTTDHRPLTDHTRSFLNSQRERHACVLRCAVEEGHLAVVQWLCETYASARPDKDILQFAAERGHFALLQWLVAHLERVSA
ncbi:hypothetical protein PybrP1_011923, partial [[Pythium] brassicae (nom. inval.)]